VICSQLKKYLLEIVNQNLNLDTYRALTSKGKKKAAEAKTKVDEANVSIASLSKEIAVLETRVLSITGVFKSIRVPEVIDLTADDESD
jgi:hypothetical protein